MQHVVTYMSQMQGRANTSPRARTYCYSGKWNILASFFSALHVHGPLLLFALHSFILLNFWKPPFLLLYIHKNLNMNNSPLGSSVLLNCGKQILFKTAKDFSFQTSSSPNLKIISWMCVLCLPLGQSLLSYFLCFESPKTLYLFPNRWC